MSDSVTPKLVRAVELCDRYPLPKLHPVVLTPNQAAAWRAVGWPEHMIHELDEVSMGFDLASSPDATIAFITTWTPEGGMERRQVPIEELYDLIPLEGPKP